MEYIFIGVIVITLFIGVFLSFRFGNKKNLKKNKKEYYETEVQKVAILPSPTERILRYDMILHRILKDYGYSGTVGDQLKAKPRMTTNLDALWSLHKLRNKLAHDMGIISPDLLERKADEFEKVVLNLLK